MLSLPLLEANDEPSVRGRARRLPSWLKRKLPQGNGNFFTHQLLRELDLETVCENARCPNRPECYDHNLETVPRLYKKVRGRAEYQRSLDLLAHVKRRAPGITTKSGLMLGLGETTEELLEVLADLRAADCDTLTLGQYLAPTLKHVAVKRYVPPEEFVALATLARTLGFKQVASGPFVRSSYHADEMVNLHAS